MTPAIFLSKIGGGTNEYADKFETLKEIFEGNRVYNLKKDKFKEKGLPPHHRKYILSKVEMLRRGVLTFEYLQRRTVTEIVSKTKK